MAGVQACLPLARLPAVLVALFLAALIILAAFLAALIRTAPDRYRFVLTNHHIVLDGWSLPLVLQEILSAYHGHRLPAAVPYRRFVTWLAGRDVPAAEAAWGGVLAGFETPTLVGPRGRRPLGPRGSVSVTLSNDGLAELARSCHTTVNIVLQAAWAQVLINATGQHDVVFGTPVSGRPTDITGADSMVGLFINTVPVRATITATTTTADLLEQLHSNLNHTLEHQHLSLRAIHRITGHDRLFDTLFAFQNYPLDTVAPSRDGDLVISHVSTHDDSHYPLVLQAIPGESLTLRAEYDTTVFDPTGIDTLLRRFTRVIEAMTGVTTEGS